MAQPSHAKGADLAHGNVRKLLFSLALPTITSQIVNMLYNLVDRVYIGHIQPADTVGALALTGVGVCFPIILLISAFAALMGMGGAPRASIQEGRGDVAGAEHIMGNCLTMLVVTSLVLTAVFQLFAEPLLLTFGGSENTIDYALDYMRIYTMGTLFVQVTLGMNAFITAQGFTSVSMKTVLIGALLNTILDPIFIFLLDMGVKGAALATVLSQAVSAIWILQFLTGKKTILKLKMQNLRLVKKIILPCLGLGISSFVMISTESILSISFTSSLQRFGGDLAVGAMTVMSSINQLVTMPLMGICQGGQPLISFNYGARKMERVKKAFYCQFGVCVAYTVVFWILLMAIPNVFSGIFTSDVLLADYTAWALKIFLAGVFSVGFQISCQQAFMALGQAKVSLLLACLRKLILLIPLIFILPLVMHNDVLAVFVAEPISDIAAATVTTITFFVFFRKLIKKQKEV